jgi:hypothetical protein
MVEPLTMLNKQEAEREAKALARSLGKGWKPTVFEEEEGWHCCVVHGPLAVYPQTGGKYICRVTDKPKEMAKKPTLLSSNRVCVTPLEAVRATVGHARIMVTKLDTIVKTAEEVLSGSLKTGVELEFVYHPKTKEKL